MAKPSEVQNNNGTETGTIIEAYPEPFKKVVLNAIYEKATDIHLNKVADGTLILYLGE